VFSAGNFGGYGSPSDTTPGNFVEAFAVGSVTSTDELSYFSSQGPTTCRPAIFPDVVAPGSNVYVQTTTGSLTTNNGTSFAAPQVAGALALLLEAYPNLTAEQQRQILINSARDLGAAGPDVYFGAGRLDVINAYHMLGGQGPHQINLLFINR